MKQIRSLNLKTINEISIQINSEHDLPALLRIIMDTARDLLNSEGSSLLLYDSVKHNLIFDIALGKRGGILAAKTVPIGRGIAGICAQDKKSILVNDAQNDPRVLHQFDAESGYVTRNILAVPMLAHESLIGVLEVVNTRDGSDFSKSDVHLLSYLSNMAGIAVYNRQLFNQVKLRADELNCIHEISQSFHKAEKLDSVADGIMESVSSVLEVERLSLILKEENSDHFRIIRMKGFSLEDHDIRIDPMEGVAGRVFSSGKPLLVSDIEKDMGIKPAHESRYKTGSFISVPILREGKVIGLINAADKKNKEVFQEFELKVLQTVASQFASILERLRAHEREMQLRNYRKDMETAAMIQKNSLPVIPARMSGIQIASRYEACREVGGDFYDLLYHSENRISAVMADVAGKGVPAALFMEYSKTVLAGIIPRQLDPASSLSRANKEIFQKSQSGIFVTCMLVQIEKEMNRFRIASAGHNHQILYRKKDKSLESLSASGKPLGIFSDTEYIDRVVSYSSGDVLVLYTDGISEANNPKLEEYGEDRLFTLVQEFGDADVQVLLDKIFDDMTEFRSGQEPSDDATLMILKF